MESGFRFPTTISTSCTRGRLLNTFPMCLAVLREARRVVKPLGRVFIQVYPWFHSFAGSHLSDFTYRSLSSICSGPGNGCSPDWRSSLRPILSSGMSFSGTMWPEYCRLNGYSARKFLSAVSEAGFCIERLHSTIDEEHIDSAPRDVPLADIVTSGTMVLLRPGKPLTNDEPQIVQLREQLRRAEAERDEARAISRAIEHSASWRVTEPARRLMARLRQLRK